jgi:hypothetical protein
MVSNIIYQGNIKLYILMDVTVFFSIELFGYIGALKVDVSHM